MVPFTYRALDLLADYEPRFAAFPKIWSDQIRDTDNPELVGSFNSFLWASVADALTMLNQELTNEEFKVKLGDPNERDRVAAKSLTDLGINTQANLIALSYFAGRRNLLEDERCWIRFTGLIDDEISIQAC